MGNKSWYSVNKRGENCLEYRPYVDYYQWLSPFSHDTSMLRVIFQKLPLSRVSLRYIWITLDFVIFIYLLAEVLQD